MGKLRSSLFEQLEHRLLLTGQDFGDAAVVGDTARHAIVAGLSLGPTVDAEIAPQANAMALGDDVTGEKDDEDGVLIPAAFVRAKSTQVSVLVTNETLRQARLEVWADFNQDGKWDDAREHVSSKAVDAGWNWVEIITPADASLGGTYVRFRLSTETMPVSASGYAASGEVEDYLVEVLPDEPHSLILLDTDRNWSVLRNSGATFRHDSWPELYQRSSWSSAVVGDFTGDGATDIMGYQDHGEWWLEKNGGTQLVGAPWGRLSVQANWQTMQVADFNNDGWLDIMGHESTGGTWWLWRNTGTSFVNDFWGRQTADLTDFFLGDFNDDHRPDILERDAQGNWWLARNEGAEFKSVPWGRYNANVQWQHVVAGDFNGDTRLDVLMQSPDGTWWLSAGTTTGLLAPRKWGRWSTKTVWTDVHVEDFNGDGIDDLIGRNADGRWNVSRGTMFGFVSSFWGRWNPNVNWSNVLVGRIDADPLPDMLGQAEDGTWWAAISGGSQFNNVYWGKSKPNEYEFVALLPDLIEPSTLDSGLSTAEVQQRSYDDYAREVLDNLMAYGTDRYGASRSELLMNAIDVRSRNSPPDLLPLDSANRVIRPGRRGPGGANLYLDQPTFNAFQWLAKITGDHRYEEFVNANIAFMTTNLVDDNGMFWWGWHRFYDAHRDELSGNRGNFHELQIQQPQWEDLWHIDPVAVTDEIEAIWQRHIVDKHTGENNRHDEHPTAPVSFAHSGGEYVYAFGFMYVKTGDAKWLDRALLVENYFWSFRNPQTQLIPFVGDRQGHDLFDSDHAHTGVTGMYARALLSTYALTGVAVFRDHAIDLLKSYALYGYDTQQQNFWASLSLDGIPVPGPRVTDDSDAKYEPRGFVDIWQPYASGKEFPLATAQAYAMAYDLTGDPELLLAARRWADVIDRALPARTAEVSSWYAAYARDWANDGTYAENYGRAISFFLQLEHVTQEDRYLDLAKRVADEAITQLYYKGFFRGHHRKPYHEAIDGVGYLLVALLQLGQRVAGHAVDDFDNY